jgi:hypothetical protein
MKNIKQFFIVGLFFATILLSCSKLSGDSFIGTWHNNNSQKELIISKVNDTTYKILVHNLESNQSNHPTINTHLSTFQNGNLIDKYFFILSYSKGKLILEGQEYEKTPDADPAQIEKEETFSNRIYNAQKRIADSIRLADSAAMAQAMEAQKQANSR